jgi:hypothetical protein
VPVLLPAPAIDQPFILNDDGTTPAKRMSLKRKENPVSEIDVMSS